MDQELIQSAEKYKNQHRRKKSWQKVVSILACIVVFCTTYALILPAITMEREAICGIPEHQHNETCYSGATSIIQETPVCSLEYLDVHEHSTECYNSEHKLICGYTDFVVHTHDESCYSEDGTLWCPLPEIKTHTHDASCYAVQEATEKTTHNHTDECYTMEQGELICTEEESSGHTHGEECFDENGELICQIEESAGHQHTDTCYEWEKVLTCELSTEPVGPTEPELICGKEEIVLHEHTASCFDGSGNLVCGKIQVLEHVHDSNCFEEVEVTTEPVLICEQTEHQHTEACFAAETGDAAAVDLEEALSAATELTADLVSDVSATWYDASGAVAEDGLIDGGEFGCKLSFTIPASAFEEGDSSLQYRLTLDAALQTDAVAGENCTPVLDTEAQMITLQVDGVTDGTGAYTGVDCMLTLSGTVQAAEDQTEVMLLGQSVPVEQAPVGAVFLDDSGAFTYTDAATGFTVTLTLESSNYTTANFDLAVVRQSEADYTNALNSFTTHGQEIEEAAIYKVYLVQKDNGQTHTNLGCAYTLEMRWPNVLFTQVDSSDFLNFTYCKNPGSEPTELSNCQVTYSEDGNVTALTATDNYYPNSAEFMFVRSSAPNGLIAGQYKLTYTEGKDTFLTDPAYSQYYNSNSPIGTAGSFHIVAFDSAYLNAHTNGNVLAKNLYAGANFGTNGFAKELSYIQNYKQVNGSSASSSDHILVIGSENTVEFVDNGNAFAVNGTKIDRPYNLIQDVDTAAAPFIDLNRVRAEISQIAGNLNGYSDANLIYTSAADLNADHSKLELTTPSGVGVVNYTAAELAAQLGSYVQIDGFQTGSNGTVVINVDCTGATTINMPQARIVIDGQLQGTSEVTEFSAGKVIWNFVNADGITIHTYLMTGIILAPGATVNINQNLNGTVVADIINVNAESHRTDFTGKVTQPEEPTEENEYYVTVQKIETGYAGSALPGAEFDLYQWDGNDWVQVNSAPLVTGASGTVMLHHLEASVAYQLVETKAPAGYVLKDGAFYFWVRTDKNQTQPNQRPSDFSGSVVEVGGTLLAANEKEDVTAETTSLTVRKLWKAADGTELTDITVESITVKVYQIADGDAETKTLYQELPLSAENDWTVTLEELPLTGSNGDGSEIQYTYTAEEDAVDGYQAMYETRDGIVTITNTKNAAPGGDYVLPETGGSGTTLYSLGGLLLTTAAGFLLLYNHTKRRKEDLSSF